MRDRLLEISFSFNSYLKPKIDNGYKILVKLIKKAFKSLSFVLTINPNNKYKTHIETLLKSNIFLFLEPFIYLVN